MGRITSRRGIVTESGSKDSNSRARLMERAGADTKSASSLPWSDSEKESYQHHADFLKRLSKLREDLIHQEQTNLANALDRLRMKSYGKEYVYSRPQKDKRIQHQNMQMDQSSKRSLLTTFEKFQRMRPRKAPAMIMPLEGKSLIEPPPAQVVRGERSDNTEQRTERVPGKSVDESVRLNLQRLATNPVPSIPRQRTNTHRDIMLENSASWKRQQTTNEARTSFSPEDRITHMQRQKQKLTKLRQDARDAEKLKLAPQSFQLDAINDEDRMNLENLNDYYHIYYVPAPASSPVQEEPSDSMHLPAINGIQPQENSEWLGSPTRNHRPLPHGNRAGFKIATDNPIPPTVCNGSCRMYVSGNKVETSVDKLDFSISQTQSANSHYANTTGNFYNCGRKHQRTSNSKQNGRELNEESNFGENKRVDSYSNGNNSNNSNSSSASSNNKHKNNASPPDSQDKMRIRVDMPSIMFNAASPEHTMMDGNNSLVRAFKQKELRQKEFSNLMEDVRELNMRTESLANSIK